MRLRARLTFGYPSQKFGITGEANGDVLIDQRAHSRFGICCAVVSYVAFGNFAAAEAINQLRRFTYDLPTIFRSIGLISSRLP